MPGAGRENGPVPRKLLAVYLALAAALAALAAAGGLILFRQTGPADDIARVANRHAYDILGWELRHLPQKWLYKLGHLLEGDDWEGDEEAIRRYFALVREIRRLERDPAASEPLAAAYRERAALENRVEDVLEGRLTALLAEQGITLSPPIFSEMRLVFPPVDFELDFPPRVLAVSPRDRIELERSYFLAPGLDRATAAALEREAEAAPLYPPLGPSALVIPTGGVSTYPSVVSQLAPYEALIEAVLHEWLHQHLALFPLGRSYFASGEARTLNETVANLAARELARLFLERYPAPQAPPTPPPSPVSGFDFAAEMRALRRRVESLLAQGRIDEAERLMARQRDEFEARGYYIRRINQAFFAFHGFYADAPASIDPIGPKLEELRRRSGSLAQFLRLAAQLTSEADLDRLLAEP